MTESKKRSGRMIHIRLPEQIHKLLRIEVASQDTTIQDWVSGLIKEELNPTQQDASEQSNGEFKTTAPSQSEEVGKSW